MTVLKLSPSEARFDNGTVAMLFSVQFKRPSGHDSRTFLAILGEEDIPEAIEWFCTKVRATRIEYQPSLLFTFEWEVSLEKYIHSRNLRFAE